MIATCSAALLPFVSSQHAGTRWSRSPKARTPPVRGHIPYPIVRPSPLAPRQVLTPRRRYLDLDQILAISFLSRTLHFVVSDATTTPLHPPIRKLLDAGPPYSSALATLGTYTHLPRSIYFPILVRASPHWILEDMVIPAGLTDTQWRQIFSARFLPSWKRYRDPPDRTSWRAAYLRILRRLVHRFSGCTHEESWTRFILLHRNGTASLNRIYSRTFDPLEIYAEIRRQNDLLRFRQEVRLVVQLQDVRVLMLGSMAHPRTLFVNPNAYSVVHPPQLEEEVVDDEPGLPERELGFAERDRAGTDTPPPPYVESVRTRALSMPLLQQPVFPQSTQQQAQSPSQPPPPPPPPPPSSGFSSFVRRLRAGSTNAASPPASRPEPPRRTSWLSRTRSGESAHGGRRPSLSLSRSTTSVGRVASSRGGEVTVEDVHVEVGSARPLSGEDLDARRSEDRPRRSDDEPHQHDERTREHTALHAGPVPSPPTAHLVYPPLTQPLPAPSHALYPNWTPATDTRARRRVARRQQKYLAASVPVGAEWDDQLGWRTWIGPVL